MRTLLLVALSLSAACGRVYQLPDPPPEDERGPVELNPTDEERADGERYIAARRTVVALYSALDSEDWEAAISLLSNETRILLAEGGSGSAVDALASGSVTVDGATYAFDPVELFLLTGATGFDDDADDVEQHETGRRKELFASNGNETRRIVVIEEGGEWRVHLRSWPMSNLSREGR